ncbi:MAG TPA: aminoacyl-tRNA hydrolase [Polyangia bacterium]|jgi:PTH1 family peptidyl-tRNA hydrolase|nr:aminoacyl-tRNA hydrolase [Polyangia bacterium]
MWLVVGLGNPGSQYAGNRHNVGFEVVDELLSRARAAPLRSKMGAAVGEATLRGQRILLCKPMEFMNISGQATARVARFWKIPVEQTVVVHDDLDLPFGRLKLGAGGGAGGHNGLKSLIGEFAPDFLRVRFGIGRPPVGHDPANYVLTDFSRSERDQLPALYATAADAVEEIIGNGLTGAMNRFNTKPRSTKSNGPGDAA